MTPIEQTITIQTIDHTFTVGRFRSSTPAGDNWMMFELQLGLIHFPSSGMNLVSYVLRGQGQLSMAHGQREDFRAVVDPITAKYTADVIKKNLGGFVPTLIAVLDEARALVAEAGEALAKGLGETFEVQK